MPHSIPKRGFVCLLAIAVIAAGLVVRTRAELPPDARERMLDELKYLASDELEGRGVDTEGIDLAAERIRQAFADAGLQIPPASGDAYQRFEMVIGTELRSGNKLAFVKPDGSQVELEQKSDFQTVSFGGADAFSAPIVFCGYGIEADDLEYNDFTGLDLEGKVALIIRRTPLQADEEEQIHGGQHGAFIKHAPLATKLRNASKRGAAAVLFVNDPYSGRSELAKLKEQRAKAEQRVIAAAERVVNGDPKETDPKDVASKATDGDSTATHPSNAAGHANPHASGHGSAAAATPADELAAAVTHLKDVRVLIEDYDADPLMKFGYGGRSRARAVPVMHISQEACNRLLEPTLGKTLAQIEKEIDTTGKPQSLALEGWSATGETRLEVVRSEVKNVVGVLEGAGPHAEETIVIGAHYDHVGRGGEGSLMPGSTEIHNGADDNASGTVALLELARRLAARSNPLPRRILFIAFTGEERGLLGSAHYVREPLVPLDQTVAMFNMDMVGRMTDDKLTIFGTGTAKRWEAWLEAETDKRGLVLTKKPEGLGPSDHSSFYAKRIPVLHFFTGTHKDYHRPGDDWEKINVEGMGRVVDLLAELVVTTAETSQRPEYVAVKGKASLQPRSGARPYFGSIPDFGTEIEGYAIQGVSPESPADKAGVKGGDVLIKLGDHPITGLDDFDLALRKFSAGESVPLVVLRGGEPVRLRVTLASPRQ